MSLAISSQLITYRFPNTPSESLQNGLQPQFELKRQHGRSVDTDAQCEWTFNDKFSWDAVSTHCFTRACAKRETLLLRMSMVIFTMK